MPLKNKFHPAETLRAVIASKGSNAFFADILANTEFGIYVDKHASDLADGVVNKSQLHHIDRALGILMQSLRAAVNRGDWEYANKLGAVLVSEVAFNSFGLLRWLKKREPPDAEGDGKINGLAKIADEKKRVLKAFEAELDWVEDVHSQYY